MHSLEAVVREAPGSIFGPSCFGPHTQRTLPCGSAGSVFIHWPKSGRQLAFCPWVLKLLEPTGRCLKHPQGAQSSGSSSCGEQLRKGEDTSTGSASALPVMLGHARKK